MKKASIYIIFMVINLSYAWELTLHIEDLNDQASDDYLIIGICDNCHDGFHYGEDMYDLPTGFDSYTDIHFFNLDWMGDIDSNHKKRAIEAAATHFGQVIYVTNSPETIEQHTNLDLKITCINPKQPSKGIEYEVSQP